MKSIKISILFSLAVLSAIGFSSFTPDSTSTAKIHKLPYKKAGLTERQAAAHLLNRFTYGATPGEIDEVVNMGLEKWLQQQLAAQQPDDSLNNRLAAYPDLNLTNAEVCRQYPPGFVVRSMAIKDSAISKDSVDKAIDKKAFNDQIKAYMDSKGLKPDQELYKQFISQHILRATYSNNQLQEVLTDFWFNHFNVSFFKGECAQFIPAYERDVVRPNVFGKFDQLLLASAKSPAMLYYLDNFTSVGPTPAPAKKQSPPASAIATANTDMMMTSDMITAAPKPKPQENKNTQGLNENYAREVMELHTLGVDGGYTQQDVTEAARVLTGWTLYPISDNAYGSAMKSLVAKVGDSNLVAKGYVREGDFLFTPNRHDQGAKTVLGHSFAAKGGYQEGVELLEMLAHHPSAAKFLCKKLAIRFVSDNPPQSLIDKMVKTFTEKDGEIAQVLVTMVEAPEFWSKNALREKTKSPFELVISSVRSLNADVKEPYQLFNWMSKMGQKIYYYQAPTGFPDKGQYWINTGSLLSRMNFGLALAQQRIPGVKVDLAALTNKQEPESADAALITYSKLLMPERNLEATYKQLTPLLNDPKLFDKVNNAAAKTPPPNRPAEQPTVGAPGDMMLMSAIDPKEEAKKQEALQKKAMDNAVVNNTMIAQVTGIIIGSPEFQRR